MMGAYSSLVEDLCWYPWRKEQLEERVQEKLEPHNNIDLLISIAIEVYNLV